MNLHSFNRLLTMFVLLSCNGVSKAVESSWNHTASDDIKPNAGIIDSTSSDDPTSDFISTNRPRHACPKYKLLDPKNIKSTRREMEQCTKLSISCQYAKYNKFRTIDGTCNNLRNPSWGKSNICLKRILPFDYADDISRPRESCTGKPLPNARHISNVFHSESKPQSEEFTTHFMEWGQMIAHDLSLNDIFKTPESGFNEVAKCCQNGPVFNDTCISISVPPSDPFFSKFGVTCINFPRTLPCRLCQGGKRFHSNQNTAYHDLSLIYGSTEEAARELRSKSPGMLEVEWNQRSGPMLPTVFLEENCISPPREKDCYHSGDARVDQNLFATTVYTYLMRHHNFICQELKKVNPPWDDERIYHEARRINIAIVQYITYEFYLPNVLGKEIMQKERMTVLPGEQYTKYNEDLDASVINEYVTFAGRYGHTQIPPSMSEVDPHTGSTDKIFVRDYFYRPFGFRYGQYDYMAKGMSIDKSKKRDVSLTDDVRNFLYRRVYRNETAGLDLAALSIVRGRGHGIPGYTYYLSYLLDKTVHTFDDLRGMMPDKLLDLLREIYESVHDIDVYSAGLAEYRVPGGIVGPTFAAVLREQYKRTKFGDRYWFEHGNEAGSFTAEQLAEIKRSSLARILCETSLITEIQRNVFLIPSLQNPIVPCKNIRRFNFHLWVE